MANSVFNKGLITLFNNLMSSQQVLPQIKTSIECQWFMEYSASYLQGVFLVQFSPFFIGKKFKDCFSILYKAKSKFDYLQSILLIGVKAFKNIEQNKGLVLLNPQQYTIKKGDYAIVISKTKETAQFVSFFTEEVDLNESKLDLMENEDCLYGQLEFENCVGFELERKKVNENFFLCSRLSKIHFLLWKTDLTARLEGHIVVFANEALFEAILKELRKRTEKPVCFFMERSPSTRTLELIARNTMAFVLEGNILNQDHLKNANFSQVSFKFSNFINDFQFGTPPEHLYQRPTMS